jgi:TonB-linked SusC/RagA family outer membrane protein
MKRQLYPGWHAIALAILLAAGGQLCTAQAVYAHIKQLSRPGEVQPKTILLKDALRSLKVHYGVDIVFGDRTVDMHTIAADLVDFKSSVEKNLSNVLRPSGLKYKRLKNGTYAIISEKPGERATEPEHDPADVSNTGSASIRSIEGSLATASQAPMLRKVTGEVLDEKGGALPGVSIVIKGKARGTVTDENGKFSIETDDDDAMLVFSYVGYLTQEVELGNRVNLRVILEVDNKLLEEVVVVGYGVQRKSDLTGSISKIEGEKIAITPVPNVDQALQGQASGVFVTSVDGRPGAQSTIRVRGGKSINAGNEPLFVVDGFISDRSIVTALNPEDIQSIDVLKDASSAAIYGARGSNGVILVTTKKGSEGQTEIGFSTSYGVQQIARKAPILSAQEYIDFANQGEVRLGNPIAFTEADRQRISNGTDWLDELSRAAPMYRAQLSVSGGDKKTKFYLSGNYFKQDGILIGNNYQRGVMRLNLSHKFSKFFEIGTNLNFSSIRDVPAKFSWESLMSTQPTLPVRQPDGSYTILQDLTFRNFNNPVARNEFVHLKNGQNQILNNTYIQLNLSDNLHWRSTFGFNRSDGRAEEFISSQLPLNRVNNLPGSGEVSTNSHISLLTEHTLTYDAALNENHRFNVLGGITAQREQRDGNVTSSSRALSDLLSVYGLGLSSPEYTNINVMYDAFSLLSFIGRANYVLKDKYLLTLTARQDASSKFGKNNRYAFFPALALGWRLSEEEFIKDLAVFDLLKLRISYGKSGNSNGIGAFQRYQGLSPVFGSLGRGVRDVGVTNNTLANDDLRWETTSQYDLGLEASVLKGRLGFEVDLYYSKTRDLLFTKEIPSQTGFINRLENIGSLQTRGVDLSMNAILLDKKDFDWNVSLNVSTYKNKILDLGGADRINTHTGGNLVVGPTGQLIVGQPLGIFTGFQTNGIYQNQEQVDQDKFTNRYTPGEFRFVDQNGDGTISVSQDLAIIGNSNPDFFGGLQNTFRYKSFQLSAFFQFTYGNDVYNLPKTTMVRAQERNPYKIFSQAWSPENSTATIPASQALNAQSSNDFNVEDGSFLRLRNLELAYTLPAADLNLPFKSLRVFVSGTNVFQIISRGFTGDDPEASSFGTNDRLRGYYNFGYPYSRIMMIGLDLKF